MLDAGLLIQRFFSEVSNYLQANGRIVMPHYHLAGEQNDPGIRGPKQGLQVKEVERLNVNEDDQIGLVSIYELKPKLRIIIPSSPRVNLGLT